MTPPDPATPSPLEALLKEVEAAERVMTDPALFALDAAARIRSMDSRLASTAPRLAAIVRVLMDATQEMLDADSFLGACRVRGSALRRADEIAGGGA